MFRRKKSIEFEYPIIKNLQSGNKNTSTLIDAIDILYKTLKGMIFKCADEGDYIYFWNEKNKLWARDNLYNLYHWAYNSSTRSLGLRNISKKKLCNELMNKLRLDNSFIKSNLDIQSNTSFLPIGNGKKISLKNGRIFDRTPSDYYTYECPIYHFDGKIDSTNVENIMFALFKDADTIVFLKTYIGYCLSEDKDFDYNVIVQDRGEFNIIPRLIKTVIGEYFTDDVNIISTKNTDKKIIWCYYEQYEKLEDDMSRPSFIYIDSETFPNNLLSANSKNIYLIVNNYLTSDHWYNLSTLKLALLKWMIEGSIRYNHVKGNIYIPQKLTKHP